MNLQRKSVRIAAAQYSLDRFASLQTCKVKLGRWVAKAATEGAELLVFPEYGAMEYALADAAESDDLRSGLTTVAAAMSEMDAGYADLARRHQVHILAASGPVRRSDGMHVNRARLFAPSGHSGFQDKMIMTPFERDWGIVPGSELTVFETAIGCIGITICYDSEFPLLVRALCEAGAEIVLVPSCTELVSGYHRVRIAALARALENGCVTVHAALVGNAQWAPAVDRTTGAAGIYVAAERGLSDTGVLAAGVLDAPQWVYASVDLAGLRHIHTSGEMRNNLDWPLQPGFVSQRAKVRLVQLA